MVIGEFISKEQYHKELAQFLPQQKVVQDDLPIPNTLITAEEFKQEGNMRFAKLSIEKAVQCYSKAIEIDPKQAIFYLNRAACYLSLGQPLLVIQDCQTAISHSPNLVKGYYRAALAYLQLDSPTLARNQLEFAIELESNIVIWKVGLLELTKRIEGFHSKNFLAKSMYNAFAHSDIEFIHIEQD